MLSKIENLFNINSSDPNSNLLLKMNKKKNNKPITTSTSFSNFYFIDIIDHNNVHMTIKNLNNIKQADHFLNDFNLEQIYKEKEFKIKINNDIVTKNLQKFKIENIIFPQEKYANYLMNIIMDVFSNPMNCGYFLKNELEFIFSLFMLSSESQMLFVRLLKRKLVWHRVSFVKYPEIANNLDPFFKELVENGFCVTDLNSIDISVLLNMLQVEEVRSICRKLNINYRENKKVLISKLLKYGNTSKAFFIGAKSPKSVLEAMVLTILQPCICLSRDIFNLFDRILILLHPIQDPSENITDLFLIFTNIQKCELLYAPVLKRETFPIFKNRLHLINFVEGKNALKNIIKFIEKKEWVKVRNLGRLALTHLSKIQIIEEKCLLPLHVKKFMPQYLWVKVLANSVDAFKKSPETIIEAVNILKILINEKNFSQSNVGRWYNELALIKMHHQKDLESCATLTLHALQQGILTEVDVSDLLERLKKLMRRKTRISEKTKILIQKAQEKIKNNNLISQFIATKTIMAKMAHGIELGGKSTWAININGNSKYYGSIEMLALQYYIDEENFHNGLHCEGLLPVTLFTICFWDELYNTFVPGVFVSPYQSAPLDLFTGDFFSNRKKSIEDKIKFIHQLDLKSFIDWMGERYKNYNQYKSLMSNILFKSNQHFKEVIACLGINRVIGICDKLISNFRLWKSGFPDLIVWNALVLKCKIIEVKGPGDILSKKQMLWLQYLKELGIETEICNVKVVYEQLKQYLK